MIETRKMSSTRQQGNQGKLGFVPTSTSTIEKEMSLIDFSDLEGMETTLNICDLSGGTGEQLNTMYQYLKNININSKAYYNELNIDRYNETLKEYPYFESLNADIFYTKIGSKRGNDPTEKKVFSILHNNPPYGYDKDRYGQTVRLEKRFFEKNTQHDIVGGIQLLELPIGVLDKELLTMLVYRYEIKIVKFPKNEYKAHKQVCVFMKKKKQFFREKDLVEAILIEIENDYIPYMDDLEGPIIKAEFIDFNKTPEIHYFRKSEVNEKTLAIGGESVWGELVEHDLRKKKQNVIKKEKPIIELLQGHVSLLLASGRYNGIMGGLLVRGGSNKHINRIVTHDEDGLETITEVEVIKPFIELTNKNGDIIYKDF